MAKKQKVVFAIRWTGTYGAQLVHLLDNGVPVVAPVDLKKGRGSVKVEYSVEEAVVHHLEWSLWFGDKELEGLEAFATLGTGEEQSIAKLDDALEHRWVGTGNAVEEAS